jgi:hypothetical protein
MTDVKKRRFLNAGTFFGVLLCMIFFASGVAVADCNRGDLDVRFCDEDGDLVADTPERMPDQWLNPDTLVFSYTPVEDPSVYENVFTDFMAYMEKNTGKKVRWYGAESYAAQVEAMRSGRLHVAGISTGPTCFGVNLAGYVPFAIMGNGRRDFRLQAAGDYPQGFGHSGPQGHEGPQNRPCHALFQLGQPGAPRALQGHGRRTGRGLQGDLLRQARQLHHGSGQQGLRCRAHRLQRSGTHGPEGGRRHG